MKVSSLVRRRSAAYTLVEIMLVLSIIAVLVGAVIYKIRGNVDIARIQRAEADFTALTTQLKAYQMLNHFFPTTSQGLEALRTRPTTDPKPSRWILLYEGDLNDPWGHPYQYECPGKKNPQGFDLYSIGMDGQANTADDIYATGS